MMEYLFRESDLARPSVDQQLLVRLESIWAYEEGGVFALLMLA